MPSHSLDQWSLQYFVSKLFVLMLCMPGLGQGHYQKKDTHTLDFDVTLGFLLSDLDSSDSSMVI